LRNRNRETLLIEECAAKEQAMSAGGWLMAGALALALGALGFVIFSMLRSIRNERTRGKSVLAEFGLGIALLVLFLVTWGGQAIAQWQTYTDEQRSHGDSAEIGDFVSEFSHSTLENWQSEFLQLFAFVSLAALYIHKGSAESKDSDEKMEAALRRIEEKLGTLPPGAPATEGDDWKLPEPESPPGARLPVLTDDG
jgi:hypothetical protein